MFFDKTEDYNNEGERGRIEKNSEIEDRAREKHEMKKLARGKVEG